MAIHWTGTIPNTRDQLYISLMQLYAAGQCCQCLSCHIELLQGDIIYTNKTGDCLSVCLFICSAMAGQTARPNGLKFGG